MAQNSSIEWTEATWNPVTGCTKVGPGCKHCYAERMAKRLQAMGHANYANGFKLTLQPQMLELPLKWKKSRAIFVNSMGDLFHDDVPTPYIRQVFEIMRRAHWHRFQVLTKYVKRLAVARLEQNLNWPPNVWMGVSIETQEFVYRIDYLRQTNAAVKFLSLEPLLGALPNLDLNRINWVIVGGESGPKSRPMKETWAIDIRDQCRDSGVPFFFKQWSGKNKKKAGRLLEGQTWNGFPSQASLFN